MGICRHGKTSISSADGRSKPSARADVAEHTCTYYTTMAQNRHCLACRPGDAAMAASTAYRRQALVEVPTDFLCPVRIGYSSFTVYPTSLLVRIFTDVTGRMLHRDALTYCSCGTG